MKSIHPSVLIALQSKINAIMANLIVKRIEDGLNFNKEK